MKSGRTVFGYFSFKHFRFVYDEFAACMIYFSCRSIIWIGKLDFSFMLTDSKAPSSSSLSVVLTRPQILASWSICFIYTKRGCRRIRSANSPKRSINGIVTSFSSRSRNFRIRSISGPTRLCCRYDQEQSCPMKAVSLFHSCFECLSRKNEKSYGSFSNRSGFLSFQSCCHSGKAVRGPWGEGDYKPLLPRSSSLNIFYSSPPWYTTPRSENAFEISRSSQPWSSPFGITRWRTRRATQSVGKRRLVTSV